MYTFIWLLLTFEIVALLLCTFCIIADCASLKESLKMYIVSLFYGAALSTGVYFFIYCLHKVMESIQ